MATVKAIKGYVSGKPNQTIFIGGLGNPAKSYTNFRVRTTVDGVVKATRNFTFYTNDTSFEWYDNTAITSGAAIFVEAWATLNGTEYYLGKSNVARPTITVGHYVNKPNEPYPSGYYYQYGVNNLGSAFNTDNYKQVAFNQYGCIEGSTITPTGIFVIVTAPSPSANTSVNYTATVKDFELMYPGEQVFGNVLASNGRWYNLGYRLSPPASTQLN